MNTPEHWRTSRQFADWFTNRSVAFVRFLGWLMIAFSLFLFAHAAYDEDRGVAAPPFVPSRRFPPPMAVVTRAEHPAQFRGLMSYEWTCPVLILLGGSALLGIVRWAERCDPFSRSFVGKKALDDCERVLDNELENFHRPLRG